MGRFKPSPSLGHFQSRVAVASSPDRSTPPRALPEIEPAMPTRLAIHRRIRVLDEGEGGIDDRSPPWRGWAGGGGTGDVAAPTYSGRATGVVRRADGAVPGRAKRHGHLRSVPRRVGGEGSCLRAGSCASWRPGSCLLPERI